MKSREIATVHVDRLHESRTNPRKAFDKTKLAELAASIKLHGILAPLLVREGSPIAPGAPFEIVCGARRYRAAKLAGLVELPVEVRELSDDQAHELQLVENAQREDLSALEEADTYRALGTHGLSVEDIARRTGKAVGHVRARLVLAGAGKDLRDNLDAGRLTPEQAYRIARLPAAVQLPALEYVMQLLEESEQLDAKGHIVTPASPASSIISLGDLTHALRERFLLRLTDASFPSDDADLVPAAGACSKCPKRSGSQRELFAVAEIAENDVCLDKTCWDGKVDAELARLHAAARVNGAKLRVLTDAQAKKALQEHNDRPAYDSGLTEIDSTHYDRAGRSQKVSTIAKKYDLPLIVAKTSSGAIVRMVEKKALDAAVTKEAKSSPAAAGAKPGLAQKKNDAKRKAFADAMETILGKCVDETVGELEEHPGAGLESIRLLAAFAIDAVWTEHLKETVERRGLGQEEGAKKKHLNADDAREALIRATRSMTVPELLGLVLELVARKTWPRGGTYSDATWNEKSLAAELCRAVRVKAPVLIAKAQADAVAAVEERHAKGGSKKAAKPTAGKKAKKKGAAR